jgi:hypothetical protein
MKVLFILKHREQPDGSYSSAGLSSGLANSARFVSDMLNKMGVASHLVHAIDNNCIDRLVKENKPTHVIIEAYWVVPEKFEVLTQLHPDIKWIIRNHSELPFLASEGIAIDWTCRYVKYHNVYVSGNSPRVLSEMITMVRHSYPRHEQIVREKVWYLPNNYVPSVTPRAFSLPESDFIDVGCFGAIRPLKNQLLQAVAAIEFAEYLGKKLRFHINATRIEGGSTDSQLKNIRMLFHHTNANGHQLIEHSWLDHSQFVNLLKHEIDIGLCVSHSETFCIVAADLVSAGVPIVASHEVPWLSRWSKADPNSSHEIVKRMKTAWRYKNTLVLQTLNLWGLEHFCENTKDFWGKHFKGRS